MTLLVLVLSGCRGDDDHDRDTATERVLPPHCPEDPCVTALASAVADEPLPADWGGQTLVVWREWLFVGAPADGATEVWGGRNHVTVYELPSLREVGRWDGGTAATGVGAALAASDIDGDGEVDLIVGAPDVAGDGGGVFVVDRLPAGPEDLEAHAVATFTDTKRAGIGAGIVVGDLDGDGASDLGLSGKGSCCDRDEDPPYDPARLYVVPASARGSLGPADATVALEQGYGRFNQTFLFDLDRDGVDELFDANGGLYGYRLPLVDAEEDVAFTTASQELGVFADTHVLGDVTGDGVPDLATFFLDHPDERRRGLLVVIPGGTVGGDVDGLPIRIEGTRLGDGLGRSAVSADVDGDGVLDLVVGAYGVYPAVDEPGRVLVFRGPLTGPLTADDAIASVSGEYASDMFGIALGVTDADGDAQADLVVTAQQYPAGANDGRVYVIPGRALVP